MLCSPFLQQPTRPIILERPHLDATVRASAPPSLLIRIARGLPFRRKIRTNDATLRAMGALCECFRRAPADLNESSSGGPGAALFAEQITAAIALLHGCIVQMDTGEGKTYAILPAAVCLARKYGRVFIISANEYLAERDAIRTQNFWNFVGIRCGLYLSGSPVEELGCAVVYTTLQALVFRIMGEDSSWSKSACSARFGAVIVDEADAVLIDDAFRPYQLVTRVEAKAYDWSTAIHLARQLRREEHILEDYVQMTATLTLEGETAVRAFLQSSSATADKFLVLRHATEIAYVAIRMARQGTHYLDHDGTIIYIDPKSGTRVPGASFPWLVPLMVLRDREPVMSVPVDKTWPITILSQFEHICGLSGTVRENALEYVLSYGLMPIEIPPGDGAWVRLTEM